jgi:hypothetical protein
MPPLCEVDTLVAYFFKCKVDTVVAYFFKCNHMKRKLPSQVLVARTWGALLIAAPHCPTVILL